MTNTDTLKTKYDALKVALSHPAGSTHVGRAIRGGEMMADFIDEVALELGWQKPKRVLRKGSKIETIKDLEALPDYTALSFLNLHYNSCRVRVLKCPDGRYRYTSGGFLLPSPLLTQPGLEIASLPEGVTEVIVPQ